MATQVRDKRAKSASNKGSKVTDKPVKSPSSKGSNNKSPANASPSNASPVNKGAAADRLSPEELVGVFALLKGSNSVELKVMITDSQHGVVRLLGFDPVEAEARQTFFFDTPDLKLNKAGLIVRARRMRGGKADTVVKLRPIDPAIIGAELRNDASFKIEVDAMPGGYVCSGSAKGRSTGQAVLDASDGNTPLESLFSPAQRAFYDAHAPAGLSMSDLVPLGPTFLLRLKQQPKGFGRPMNVEMWLYPDGSRILELSTKGEPSEAFQLAAEFRAYVTSRGVEPTSDAATKTGSALAYFSKHRSS